MTSPRRAALRNSPRPLANGGSARNKLSPRGGGIAPPKLASKKSRLVTPATNRPHRPCDCDTISVVQMTDKENKYRQDWLARVDGISRCGQVMVDAEGWRGAMEEGIASGE